MHRVRLALVTNPRAGRGRGIAAAQAAEHVFRAAGWDAITMLTERPGHATELARRAFDEGFQAVAACGGDGTLSQVLAGLLDTGVPVGAIPAGTGNDFARTMGVSRDPVLAAQQIVDGRPAQVDLLEINGGAFWSVNVIGLGLDAAVALRINRRRRLTGGVAAYLTAVAQELLRYRPTHIRLRVDDEEWEGEALLLAVANARSYGAGMMVAPMAEIDDGILNVVLVRHMSRASFLRSFPRVYRGTHLTHPAVSTWEGREVRIEAVGGEAPVLIDGDVQCHTPLSVRVSPRRGEILVPGVVVGRP